MLQTLVVQLAGMNSEAPRNSFQNTRMPYTATTLSRKQGMNTNSVNQMGSNYSTGVGTNLFTHNSTDHRSDTIQTKTSPPSHIQNTDDMNEWYKPNKKLDCQLVRRLDSMESRLASDGFDVDGIDLSEYIQPIF